MLLGGNHAVKQFFLYCGGSKEIEIGPHRDIISSLLERNACLFGREANHKLGAEAPVLLSKKKSAAEVTLYWWGFTVLKN